MINFRKYFNLPSKEQQKLIDDGIVKLKELANKKSVNHNEHERTRQDKHNSICPNCGGTSVVNKISNVEGNGQVSGSFYFGSGSLYGSSKIRTNNVKHCNNCGNQWKLYETNFRYERHFLVDFFNDINTAYEGKYSFADKIFEILKDIPAESIWSVFIENHSECYGSTQRNLSLKILRTKFKSIY